MAYIKIIEIFNIMIDILQQLCLVFDITAEGDFFLTNINHPIEAYFHFQLIYLHLKCKNVFFTLY